MGLALLFLFFFSIWLTLYRGRDVWIVRLAAAFSWVPWSRETLR